MKKLALLVSCAFVVALVSIGCSTAQTPTGYSTVRGGMIYNNTVYPSEIKDSVIPLQKKFDIIGKVHGQSSQTCILSIAAFGDGGIQAAIDDSLKGTRDADEVIDIKVDSEVVNVLYLFTRVTTHIYGTAIKYTEVK
jgi:hypothetical protein